MAEASLSENVSNLMRKLFCSRIKTGDGVVVLPPTTKAADDDIVTATGSDYHALGKELIDAGQQIFVGNVNAPEQRSYIRAQIQDLDLDPEKKPCAWFPVCSRSWKECGGYRRKGCKFFGHRNNDTEFISRCLEMKRVERNEKKRMNIEHGA
jgi:hypothetical protein